MPNVSVCKQTETSKLLGWNMAGSVGLRDGTRLGEKDPLALVLARLRLYFLNHMHFTKINIASQNFVCVS